jgi:hypothetical protein
VGLLRFETTRCSDYQKVAGIRRNDSLRREGITAGSAGIRTNMFEGRVSLVVHYSLSLPIDFVQTFYIVVSYHNWK